MKRRKQLVLGSTKHQIYKLFYGGFTDIYPGSEVLWFQEFWRNASEISSHENDCHDSLVLSSSLSVMWHLIWHAPVYANVKRQKSIRQSLRNRDDVIGVIQAFSHACVSVSDGGWLSPLWLSSSRLPLCLISHSHGPVRGKTISMRGRCDFPEETEASCPRLNVSDCTGIIYLYHIGSMQLLAHVNSLCLMLCIHSSVPMEARVNVCCRLSGRSTHDQCLSPLMVAFIQRLCHCAMAEIQKEFQLSQHRFYAWLRWKSCCTVEVIVTLMTLFWQINGREWFCSCCVKFGKFKP